MTKPMRVKDWDWINQVHVGDCRTLMRQMIFAGIQVQCVVTSPPYWGLRDYGHADQFGLEATPGRHVQRMRNTFRLVRDLLSKDGTLWLNYGDSYASAGGAGHQGKHGMRNNRTHTQRTLKRRSALGGLKPKDLIGMPWRVAFALQADGWWLRSPIIWHKLNPMPESTKDRPTTAHEYIFLMSKRAHYYYDYDGVREPVSEGTHARFSSNVAAQAGSERANGGTRADRPMKAVQRKPVAGWDRGDGDHNTLDHARSDKDQDRADAGLKDSTKFGRGAGRRNKQDGHGRRHEGFNERWDARVKNNDSFNEAMIQMPEDRNMRTVWSFSTEAFKGAHFATFPRELVARCILAGSRPGDIVFDPFMGSGTVAEVALSLGRRYIGCEINPKYVEMFKRYRSQQIGMPL